MGLHRKIINIEVTVGVLDDCGNYVRDETHEWCSPDEDDCLSQEQLHDALNVVMDFVQLSKNIGGEHKPKEA